MTTVFQVLVGDDFLVVLLTGIRAIGWSAVVYFIFLVLIGKYLLIQLFLAIILGLFEDSRMKANYDQSTSKAFISKILRIRTQKKSLSNKRFVKTATLKVNNGNILGEREMVFADLH